MNSMTSHRVAALLRNRWQSVVDWLAGGPYDPQKIEAKKKKYPTWYRMYALTLVGIVSYGIVLLYPLILTRVLNATPNMDQMQTIQVRILKTREIPPHLDMQLADGRVQSMEWPLMITFFRGTRFPDWTKAQRLALEGCQATAQVAPVRGTVPPHYRVWSLSCPATSFDISMAQTTQWLNRSMQRIAPLELFLNSIISLFLIVIFLRERRGVI